MSVTFDLGEQQATSDGSPSIDAAALAATVGPLARERIALPGAEDVYEIARPADFDRLLDAAAADPEQNLPYWATVWPSGVALAAEIAREPARVRGRRCLELGSGLGVTAIAALRAGADLLATDYAPEALALCRLNTRHNAGREPPALQINWRAPNPDLFALAEDGFPLVLAADVLYERRDVEPLLALLERIVAPQGELWLAEPRRPPATRFLALAGERGWVGEVTASYDGPWPDPADQGVTVRVHRLRRG